MTPMLLAISGPLKGALFRLSNEEVTIGRHSSNQLSIGDLPVSRRHCVIERKDGQYTIRDLDSNNGTFVNRERISEHVLADGDEIGIGNTIFRFVAQEPTERIEVAVSVQHPEPAPKSTVRLRKEDIDFTAEAAKPAGGQTQFLQALSQLATILDSTEPMEAIEAQLLKLASDVVPAEQGAIVLANSPRGEGVSVFGWNRQYGPCPTPRVSQSVIDAVVRDRSSFMSSDMSADALSDFETHARTVTSVIAVPLIVRGKIQGVIYLDTTDPSHRFSHDDLGFVTAISSYMALALDHSRRLQDLETENRRLREVVGIQHEMVVHSAAMRKVYQRIARIAPTDATVLIGGETGTGKELAARAVHRNSPRADQPFEAINCALLNETMLESELFGHEKGAFTSAVTQKRGKLEIADGGTVFLDEIGELPQPTQSMLLRVLQDRTFYRLGGTRRIQVNIRIIAATNRNLQESIKEKTFHEDLYYRLNVVSLTMPPLRERREDIPLLAKHFLARATEKNKRVIRGVSANTISLLQSYDWPGNVRELENTIEHAVVFGSGDEIEPDDLPERLLDKAIDLQGAPVLKYHDAVRESKKQIVLKALEQANGNYSEAAALLNVHVNNLHRLIRELDLKASMQRGKSAS
jgi:Nif-specific regulatory protein